MLVQSVVLCHVNAQIFDEKTNIYEFELKDPFSKETRDERTSICRSRRCRHLGSMALLIRRR
jgi:hypothetical protein